MAKTHNFRELQIWKESMSSSYELETQLILVGEIYQVPTETIIGQLTIIQKIIGA